MIDLAAATPKGFHGGTHRLRPPEETLADYGRFMGRMGITRLADVTGLDRLGLPVVVSVRPNSRALSTSQGKGETLAAAKASALMESIEGWHAERIERPLLHGSWRAMCERREAADPARLPLRSDVSVLPDRPISWIEGWDLMNERPCWVPFDMVSTNFVFQPGTVPLFNSGSNGLASGNSLSEATVHGLCEVVERDAIALWEAALRGTHKQSQVDLATVQEPGLRALLDRLEALDAIVAAWDLTSDIGIPTFMALVADNPDSREWRRVPPMSGSGTHLSPEIALSRAIHEAIQSRLTLISGSRDDIVPAHFVRTDPRAEDVAFLQTIRHPPPTRPFAAARPPVSATFEGDIRTILDGLRRCGLDSAILVDLRLPDIGIPVVKLIVPGLEGPTRGRYQPGPRARAIMRQAAQAA